MEVSLFIHPTIEQDACSLPLQLKYDLILQHTDIVKGSD